MKFEVLNALLDLDALTPYYLLQEIFHHGDLKVRSAAVSELRALNADRRTAAVLREMIRPTR